MAARTAKARSEAAQKAWDTRRANARKADYRARALKAWETIRANKAFEAKVKKAVGAK